MDDLVKKTPFLTLYTSNANGYFTCQMSSTTFFQLFFVMSENVVEENLIPYAIGFSNLGNTCYMNATFHLFSQIQELADYFLEDEFADSEYEEGPDIGYYMHTFFDALQNPKHSFISLKDLRQAINYKEQKFNSSLPQDSQEYVKYVYNILNEHFPLSPINLLQFRLISTANQEYSSPQGILELYLLEDVKDGAKVSIYKLFDFNFKDKLMEKAPKYLLINMKLDVNHQKQNLDLDFPINSLDLSKYVKINENKHEYELIAVMHHMGNFSEDGHDTAFIKRPEGWFYLNDRKVIVDTTMPSEHPPLGRDYHYLLRRKD